MPPRIGLADAQEEGLSFEEAMERLDETGAVEAFEEERGGGRVGYAL